MHHRLIRAIASFAGGRAFRLFARALEKQDRAAGELRLLDKNEVLELCRDPALDLSAEKVGAAFARGDLCAGAFDAGKLAGYCWYAFAPLPHLDGVWVEFGPDVAWVYKSYVRPEHRAKGIARALYRFGDGPGLERGRAVSVICVESHNRPSIAAARGAGYSPAGWAAYLRRGGRLQAWHSRSARRFGVRFLDPAQ
jgi:GNAT superfamily N-acetyltransferase